MVANTCKKAINNSKIKYTQQITSLRNTKSYKMKENLQNLKKSRLSQK